MSDQSRWICVPPQLSDDPEAARQTALRFIERMKKLPGAPNTRLYSKSEARAMWKIRGVYEPGWLAFLYCMLIYILIGLDYATVYFSDINLSCRCRQNSLPVSG